MTAERAPGSTVHKLLLLAAAGWLAISALAAAPPEPATATTFRLAAPAGAALPATGSIVLVPSAPVAAEDEAVIVPTEGKGSVAVSLPAGSRWQVSTRIPGYWSRPEVVTAESGGGVETLRLWPLATVTATVQGAARGEAVPGKLSIATVELPGKAIRPDVPQARVLCSIGDHGKLRCDVPAATVDLVLAASGFVPVYRWQVHLAPGRVADLGRIELHRGASVVGWAATEQGSLDPSTCRVRLIPVAEGGGGGDLTAAARLQATALSGRIRKDGFFQLQGVAPGTYRLAVEQPGYVPASFEPLSVRAGGETFVNRPLTLRRPLDLRFTVVPPLDWLNARWEVHLARRAEADSTLRYGPATSIQADEQGVAVARGQSEGRFKVDVVDSRGNRLLSLSDLEVTGPADADRTLHVDFVTIRGEVSLGEEPLAARLWFGGRYGITSIEIESGADGKFHGVLPRTGSWPVEVQADEPRVAASRKVEIAPRPGGTASVEIRLPSTRVFGRVVDPQGQPAPGANVYVQSGGAILPLQSDGEGRFEARAVPEGLADLSAERGEEASDRVGVALSADTAQGPVELRLRDLKAWSGSVLTEDGPARGARVLVLPWQPPLTPGDAVPTDLDGRFTAHVPSAMGTALVVVASPGAALEAFEIAGDQPPLLRVSRQGGDVEVLLGRSEEELAAEGLALGIWQNGHLLPSSALADWSTGHGLDFSDLVGSTRREPDLAPGAYEACLVETARLPGVRRDSPVAEQGGRCASGLLTAAGTLQLDLRSPTSRSSEHELARAAQGAPPFRPR